MTLGDVLLSAVAAIFVGGAASAVFPLWFAALIGVAVFVGVVES